MMKRTILSLLSVLPAFSADSPKKAFKKFIDLDYRERRKYTDFASSVLKETGKPDNYYQYKNVIDGEPNTAWVPAKPGGIGEFIYDLIAIEEGMSYYKDYQGKQIPMEIFFINGYAKTDELFQKYNRVKKGLLECYEGHVIPAQDNDHLAKMVLNATYEFTFDDTIKPQRREFALKPRLYKPEDWEYKSAAFRFMCKFTIKEIYPGTKYNHTPISEFRIAPRQ
jgi:hypothetical protein